MKAPSGSPCGIGTMDLRPSTIAARCGSTVCRRPFASPKMRFYIQRPPFGCLQSAYNLGTRSQCKRQRARRTAATIFIFLRKFGAGEGIRTPDPNLGKVVLYP